MNPDFQEGRRPRANAVASLAHTGHASPLSRRPNIGAVAHALSLAGRPGPRPMSARQTTAVNQWNAATKRVMDQFLRDAQNTSRQRAFNRENAAAEADWSDRVTKRAWESKPFPRYDPRKGNAYDADVVDTGGWATGYHGHKFGEMWVYIRAKEPYNTLEYAVLNPQTGNLLVFTPEAALAPQNRVYMSEADQVRSTAAGTGVAGGYLEKGFMGLSVGILAAPLVLAASETAVGGVVITGFRTLGTQMVKQFTWSTFRQKVFTDLFVQSAAGTLKNGADWKKTAGEINLTAPFVAWLLPGSTWAAAARNSVVKASLKANTTIDEQNNIGFRVQLPHLDSMEGFAKYLTDIGTDAVATMAKAKLVTGATPAARWASQAMQRTGTAAGRWIAAQRVTLGTWGTIGTSVAAKVAKDQEKKRITERVEKLSPAHPRQ